GVGSLRLFNKVVDAVKLAAVSVDPEHQELLAGMAKEKHGAAKVTGLADLLLHKGDAWHAYDCAMPAALEALTAVLKAKYSGDTPLKGRVVAVVGITAQARALAAEMVQRGANVILVSYQKQAGMEAAQAVGCRFVLFEALYSTIHDVVVVCDEEKDQK